MHRVRQALMFIPAWLFLLLMSLLALACLMFVFCERVREVSGALLKKIGSRPAAKAQVAEFHPDKGVELERRIGEKHLVAH